MLRSSSSDRAKILICICAIASSTLTLAAYFGALDYASRSVAQATHVPGAVFDIKTIHESPLFPSGLGEIVAGPTAAS